jgi:type IV pilus assembly protein PilN
MIKINLFPFRAIAAKENIKRQITIYLLSTIFLVLAMGYYYLDFSKKITSLREKHDVKKKELDKYKDTTTKIKELNKTKAEIEVKLKTIQELEKGKTGPVKLLDDIAMSIPKDKLWLTNFKETQGSLNLDGTAMDNETVADFMGRLKSTESIKSVLLVKTKQKKIKGFDRNLKDFSLICKTYAFKEKAPPKPKKKKGRRR